MKKSLLVMILALTTTVFIACGPSEPPAETTTVEQPGMGSPSDVSPWVAQSWIDDVTIGSELAADGSMTTGRTGDDFAPGQPIHLAMDLFRWRTKAGTRSPVIEI
jgi:hypothetical protein